MECRELTVGYHAHQTLAEVDLTLAAGTVTALIGVNGSGKTTLIRTLAGLLAPIAGSISLNGRDIKSISAHQRARLLSVVFTNRPNAGMLDVKTLVSFGRQPWTGPFGRPTAEDRTKVEEALRMTGTEAFADRGIHALSDGELQRVLIARAVAQDTPVMLLDEPTAHLDIVQRARVATLLKAIARERGAAILYSTHDLENVLVHADAIALAGDGHLWNGTPQEAERSGVLGTMLGWERSSGVR